MSQRKRGASCLLDISMFIEQNNTVDLIHRPLSQLLVSAQSATQREDLNKALKHVVRPGSKPWNAMAERAMSSKQRL